VFHRSKAKTGSKLTPVADEVNVILLFMRVLLFHKIQPIAAGAHKFLICSRKLDSQLPGCRSFQPADKNSLLQPWQPDHPQSPG
jgi:hypothetical protein